MNGSKPKFNLPAVPKKDRDFAEVKYRASVIRKENKPRHKQY